VIQHGELEGRLHFVGALLKYSAWKRQFESKLVTFLWRKC
jgi:hypothetical protein